MRDLDTLLSKGVTEPEIRDKSAVGMTVRASNVSGSVTLQHMGVASHDQFYVRQVIFNYASVAPRSSVGPRRI